MTTKPPTGHYPIASTAASEQERLRLQDEAWSAQTDAFFQQIGVSNGWQCLDLGCGPGGLTRRLAASVGADGKVTGLEFNPDFVKVARQQSPANVEIIQGDAYRSGLPDNAFDLVHMRFLASVSGDTEQLLHEAVRMARPGGIVAIQEADASSMRCYPPNPAWDRLICVLGTLMPEAIGDFPVAQQFYSRLQNLGLTNVGYRPSIVGVTADHPWRDFIPSTTISARGAILDRGLIAADEFDRLIADCRAHLAAPGTAFISPTLVQVWGRKPAD